MHNTFNNKTTRKWNVETMPFSFEKDRISSFFLNSISCIAYLKCISLKLKKNTLNLFGVKLIEGYLR